MKLRGRRGGRLFCPAARFAARPCQNGQARLPTGIRPILESSFSAVSCEAGRLLREPLSSRTRAFGSPQNSFLIAGQAFDAAAIASMTGTMLNSLDLEGRPQDTRVVVAMSGGVDSSATAALLKSEGYDVVGITLQLYDHGAATHRKGACCAGQDIHDARNVAERIGIPHYVLDYEEPLPRIGDRQFRRQLRLGRNAGALHRVQPLDQVPRPAQDRARARRVGACHRPLCRLAPSRRRIARAGLRGRCRSRPELFPVRDHARAARLSALSARRHDQAAGARTGAALSASKSPTSRTARTSASCRAAAIPTSSAGCGRTR